MNEREKFLEPLTPIILDEKHKKLQSYENYEKAIDEAFAHEDICNIVITGPYGAGKSTIMQTYEADHPKNYVHISLAKFGEEIDPQKGKFTQRELEIKIINQIIHQISEKVIPQTKFHTKREVDDKTIGFYTGLLFVLIASLSYLFVVPASMWDKTSGLTKYETFVSNGWNIFVLGLASLSFIVLLFLVVRRQMISPLIKAIQVDKSKIELSDTSKDKDEHQFNRYMDELIYIFKNGKIDALVLDDIDRFGQIEVFSELREMNYLINKKLQLLTTENENPRVVKFFYMVKDELFSDFEQRTKFFDLIIPIVPAMDSSNSFDLFMELMEADGIIANESKDLDLKYIKMICLNIHDYRVLKNICNEYKIFFSQLRVPEILLSPTKLFAMVTYKNLWPEDYALLQRKDGWVYGKIQSVSTWQKNREEKLLKDIADIQNEISLVGKEALLDIADLDSLFFMNPKSCQKGGYFSIDGKSQWSFRSNKEFLKELRKAKEVVWSSKDYYGNLQEKTYTQAEIQSWFQMMEANPEYKERKNAIEHKNISWRKEKEAEIEKIRNSIAQIKMMTLSDIMSEAEYVEESQDAIRSLIFTFLKDGMIGDDYQSYMTYFYPYSLSADEIAYLNCVRTGDKNKSVDFKINNHKMLMEHLRVQDYQSRALPNYSLLNLALLHEEREIIKHIFTTLKTEKNTGFIIAFCKQYKAHQLYQMVKYWPTLLNDVLHADTLAWEAKKEALLQFLSQESDTEYDIDSDSVDLIVSHEEEIINECTMYQMRNYLLLGVLVENLLSPEISEEKRAIICADNAFECTTNNVEYILNKASNRKEEVVLNILNDERMPYDEKEQLIHVMNGVLIQDISKVSEETGKGDQNLWKLLLKEHKVAFTANNILCAWEREDGFYEELITFMKNHFSTTTCGLTFKAIREFMGETEGPSRLSEKMVRQIFMLQNFGKGYVNLLQGLNMYYDSFNFEELDKNNLETIIRKTKIVRMNENHLLKIRKEWSPNVTIDWIVRQISLYCTLMKAEKLRVDNELHALIYDERIWEEMKCKLIDLCKEPVLINDSFNSVVVEKILETEKFAGNYGVLFGRYIAQQRYSKKVKALIEDYSIRHIKEIIPLRTMVPNKILELALDDARVLQSDKKMLIAKQAEYLQKSTMERMLSKLEEKEFLAAIQYRQVRVVATEAAQVLLDALISKEWVSSYKADGDYYIVYPKKKGTPQKL